MAPLATEEVVVSDKGRSAFEWHCKNGPANSGPREATSADRGFISDDARSPRIQADSVVGFIRPYAPGSTLQRSIDVEPVAQRAAQLGRSQLAVGV